MRGQATIRPLAKGSVWRPTEEVFPVSFLWNVLLLPYFQKLLGGRRESLRPLRASPEVKSLRGGRECGKLSLAGRQPVHAAPSEASEKVLAALHVPAVQQWWCHCCSHEEGQAPTPATRAWNSLGPTFGCSGAPVQEGRKAALNNVLRFLCPWGRGSVSAKRPDCPWPWCSRHKERCAPQRALPVLCAWRVGAPGQVLLFGGGLVSPTSQEPC